MPGLPARAASVNARGAVFVPKLLTVCLGPRSGNGSGKGGWVALVVVCALAYGGRRANAAAADHGKLSRETR